MSGLLEGGKVDEEGGEKREAEDDEKGMDFFEHISILLFIEVVGQEKKRWKFR